MSILSVDNISPIGSGTSVTVNSAATLILNNVNSTGVVTATSLTVNGDVTLGNTLASDEVTFNSKVNTNLLPSTDGNKDLGSSGNRWGEVHAATFHGSGANLTGVLKNVVEDSSPQLGGALDTNGKNINFGNSTGGGADDRLVFGTGSDLNLYSDGTNVRYEGNNLHFKNAAGNQFLAKMTNGGAVELFHNTTRVVKTNTYGLQVGLKAVNDDNNHVATVGWALADDWTKVVFDGSVAANSPLTIRNQNATYNRYMCYFKYDGGFANYSANDINLCDERVKKDFADVSSQWNNIKNIGFKHFRYKEDSSSEPLKIGVVAQQIETVYPDLIDESWPQDDANPNTGEGTFYKGVKEEQLLMYAVKALQEAQARIETLEAEVAALKGS